MQRFRYFLSFDQAVGKVFLLWLIEIAIIVLGYRLILFTFQNLIHKYLEHLLLRLLI